MNDPKEFELAYMIVVYAIFGFLALSGLIYVVSQMLKNRRQEQPVMRSSWPQTELIKQDVDGVIYAVANPRFTGKRTLPANYREPFRP